MKLQGAIVLTALVLSGCASAPSTIDAVASQTQPVNDPFQKLTWMVGPYLRYHDHGYSGRMYLSEATNSSGLAEFQLGVENTSDHPETFTGAAAKTGDTLSLQQLSAAYDGEEFSQKVRVTVPKALLQSCTSTGLTVRLYGQQRVLDVTIPGFYIAGFLQRS